LESRLLSISLHFLIILIAPPLFVGIINRIKSIFAGRKGPPILQLYFDIYKLLRKGGAYSKSTSFLFRIIPISLLVVTMLAGTLLPVTGAAVFSFWGDAILFVYLFALGRFLIITAAMDTGGAFEGMGASREAAFGAFAELTAFVVIIALSVFTGFASLDKIFYLDGFFFRTEPAMVLLFCAFFFILLTENSRMPIDDPNTHLELTMIHEVMVLDYSGPDLAIILYGSSVKIFIFMVFAALLVFPNPGLNSVQNAAATLLKAGCMSVIIGIVESVTSRIRLIKIPQLLIASFVVSLFALISTIHLRSPS